jgi:23S rRNA (cytidine1920-2'-O)/16S rRNA (cytidine1409-2'-O)-methyltransferase
LTKKKANSKTARSASRTPPKRTRTRLDIAVAEAAHVSRERAQGLILAGDVRVDGVPQRKAGFAVPDGATLEIVKADRYVSRGGYKLERALSEFKWSPAGLRCLDVGASTGGFTDCLLQNGALSVTALDVGYGHLSWALRQDARVAVIERTNFRHADVASIGAPFDFVTVDVSFISLTKLVAQFVDALAPSGRIIALIKPQFEAGRSAVQEGGVVRSHDAQIAAIENVITAFDAAGLSCQKLTFSGIKGPAGNIEFLVGAQRDGQRQSQDVAGVVRKAHEALDCGE